MPFVIDIDLAALDRGGPTMTPEQVRVTVTGPAAGERLVHLPFRRDVTAACAGQVVLEDCRKSPLPTGTVVPIEFMPGDPGERELTGHMGMLRGRIIVEAA